MKSDPCVLRCRMILAGLKRTRHKVTPFEFVPLNTRTQAARTAGCVKNKIGKLSSGSLVTDPLNVDLDYSTLDSFRRRVVDYYQRRRRVAVKPPLLPTIPSPACSGGWGSLFHHTPGPGHVTESRPDSSRPPPREDLSSPSSPDPDSRPDPTSKAPTPTPAFTFPLSPTRLISSIRSISPDPSSPDQRQGTMVPVSPDPEPKLPVRKPCLTNPRPWSPPNKYRWGEERGWTKKKLTPPAL